MQSTLVKAQFLSGRLELSPWCSSFFSVWLNGRGDHDRQIDKLLGMNPFGNPIAMSELQRLLGDLTAALTQTNIKLDRLTLAVENLAQKPNTPPEAQP